MPFPAAFGEVKKRVRTTAGGSTGSVRNLRIREDTAKYLLNLDTNSAHYDPKSRSMREDPNPNKVIMTRMTTMTMMTMIKPAG
jgi:pre-mRNA-processing factor SLU7